MKSIWTFARLGCAVLFVSTLAGQDPKGGQEPKAGEEPRAASVQVEQMLTRQKRALTMEEIRQNMLVLVDNFPDFTTYEFYLLSIPLREDQLEKARDPGDEALWYNDPAVTAKNRGIRFARATELWKGDKTVVEGNPRGVSRFVEVNDMNVIVPIAVGKGLADSFLAGLIAKLYSDGLFRILVDTDTDSLDERFPIVSPRLKQDLGALARNEADALRAFSKLSTYGTVNKKGLIPAETFTANFAKAQQRLNLKASGMIKGWECGCRILEQKNHEQLTKAALNLIAHRFGPRQCAKITAYTLMYLEGWSQGIKNLNEIKAQGSPNADSIQTILESLAESEEGASSARNDTQTLSDILYEKMSFVSLSLSVESSKAGGKDEEKLQCAVAFQEYLFGFREGMNSAAGDLFSDAYELGFEAGYQRGFKDGYSAGFAAARGAAHNPQTVSLADKMLSAFKGTKITLKGVMSATQDVIKVFKGDFSPIEKQVNKAKSWLKKTFGF